MTLGRYFRFWGVIFIGLVIIFGAGTNNYILGFYFSSMLLPVALLTSWFFNDILVKRYLLAGRWRGFVLYFIYSLIVSLWLQMLVIIAAFVVIVEYNYNNLDPVYRNVMILAVIIYLIVFIQAFINMFRNYTALSEREAELREKQEIAERGHIIIRADRKNRPVYFDDILYVESRADYIEIKLLNESLMTREKISRIGERLPENFIRIHRSFLVNREKVTSYNREEVFVGETRRPVERKYKDNLDALSSVST